MKRILFLFISLCVCYSAYCQKLKVTVSGNVDFNNAFESLNEAGSDFDSPIISSSDLLVSIMTSRDPKDKRKWGISVRRNDSPGSGNDEVELYVKRMGKGSGRPANKITGGTTYMKVDYHFVPFFQGSYKVSNIPVSIMLSGVSAVSGAQEYSTSVEFTIYER